jgi:hypothetical protein
MENLSPVNRPVNLAELAASFGVPIDRLERLVLRHQIAPACKIGRMRVYGSPQVRRIYAALNSTLTPSHTTA